MTRAAGFIHRGLSWAIACLAMVAAPCAFAQDYPYRPIRLLIGFAGGSTADIVARLIGQHLGERLGQPIIVEARPGGTGLIANDAVVKSPPDGYTLGLLSGGHASTAAIMKKLPYDPVNDFAWISTVIAYPMVIGVVPESPIKSFADLIARAKAAPGRISYGSPGIGSIHHLLGEWLNMEAGTNMIHVPFKGEALAFVEVIAGRVDVMLATTTFAGNPIRSGKLRPLGITAARRYALLPEIPPVAETLREIELISWQGLMASPATPPAIIDRISRELRAVLALPEIERRFAEFGGVPAHISSAEMRARVERDIVRWKRIVEVKNIERQ
ncbi:MAG: tripartite tricarboxylate transporter substrate binding protein [Betaproteobacteria bacterium]|nr:tripartite tricarboxylate transporter substrate binding protein [Betaproteobacteria bacterium]